MDTFMNEINSLFYVDYSIVNIIAIYTIIKLTSRLNYKIIKSSTKKRIITIIVSIVVAIIFNLWFDDEPKKLLVSAFLSIVAYDYLIKKLLTFLNIK